MPTAEIATSCCGHCVVSQPGFGYGSMPTTARLCQRQRRYPLGGAFCDVFTVGFEHVITSVDCGMRRPKSSFDGARRVVKPFNTLPGQLPTDPASAGIAYRAAQHNKAKCIRIMDTLHK